MNLNYESLLLVFSFVVSFFVVLASTPLTNVIAYKIGAIDIPKDERRMHNKPIPRLGGLAIFYGVIVSILVFTELTRSIVGILIGGLIIVILGIIDDARGLRPLLKLFVQIGAALVVVANGVEIRFFTNPFVANDVFALGIWGIPLSVLWIVGVTNALNLIDGLDGLAVGVSTIASLSLFFVSLIAGQPQIALITAAIAGACLGFLPYNLNPAKVFAGDTGATFLGFILACMSVQGLYKSYTFISFVVPLLALGLPIFDTCFAIIRRVLTGKPPMQADRGHLHHRLVDMGFSHKQTVIVLYTISALSGVSAVLLIGSGIAKALILMAAMLIFIVAAFKLVKLSDNTHQIPNPAVSGIVPTVANVTPSTAVSAVSDVDSPAVSPVDAASDIPDTISLDNQNPSAENSNDS